MRHVTRGLMVVAALTFCALGGCGEDSTGPTQGEEGWQEITSQGITFQWRVMGDSLEMVLSAPTTGWVGVGFDPTQQMEDANFLLGYYADGSVEARDDWGTGAFSHASDLSLGGTDDISVDGGDEAGGETTVEMTIPMDSGDSYDKSLVQGESYTIILAHGQDGADDFSSQHQVAASVSLEL